MTHDYERHGTTTLFAAMNALDGTVIGRNMQRHRHQEFIRFLNVIEKQVPVGKTIHAIVDDYAAHKHPNVRMARTSSVDVPLHTDLRILAQRRRRLLRHPHQAAPEARRLSVVVSLQAAINRFLEEPNHRRSPSPGPPIQTRSSPPSGAGTKRSIPSTSMTGDLPQAAGDDHGRPGRDRPGTGAGRLARPNAKRAVRRLRAARMPGRRRQAHGLRGPDHRDRSGGARPPSRAACRSRR